MNVDESLDGVAIVGAGPVGLTAAVALAREGVPVTVFEAGAQLSNESRASTFHPSSLELLAELGVAERALEAGLVVKAIQFRDRDRGLIAELDYSLLSQETPFPFRLQLEQSKMTPLLLERLADFPGSSVRFGHRVVAVEQSAKAAVLEIDTEAGRRRIGAPLVVGADGAGSQIRGALGIGFEGSTYPERFLVLSTSFEFKELWHDIAYVNYVSDPRQWYALLRTPDQWRLTVAIRTEAEEQIAGHERLLQEKAREVLRIDIDLPVVHSNIYRVHRRLAPTFQLGRCVLIGDAAHVNNPTGGLGMNSGILDAYFLAPAAAAALEGDQPSLESYADRQRRLALDVVGHYSNSTWVALSQSDETARRRWADDLARLAGDREQVLAYLKEISLLNALAALRSQAAPTRS